MFFILLFMPVFLALLSVFLLIVSILIVIILTFTVCKLIVDNILLFLVAILPVIVLAFYIYHKDKNKETIGLLVKLFIWGLGALCIAAILENLVNIFIDYENLSLVGLFIYIFFCVALVEVLCKWFFVYKMSYNHYEFDEVFDIIVYSAFVSLWFACFENIWYVLDGDMEIAFWRGLTAVPCHFFDGIFMWYYLAKAKVSDINKNYHSKKINIFLSILIPVIFHCIYDFCCFSDNEALWGLFFLFVIIYYSSSFKRIKKMSGENRKLKV